MATAARKKPRKVLMSFAIDPELRDALRAVQQRQGISTSEQLRRGARLWLDVARRLRGMPAFNNRTTFGVRRRATKKR